MHTRIDDKGATLAHWHLLNHVTRNALRPREFREKWKLTNGKLAELLCVDEDVVQRWFFKEGSKNRREVPEVYLVTLAAIDYIWTGLAGVPPHIKKMYDRLNPPE